MDETIEPSTAESELSVPEPEPVPVESANKDDTAIIEPEAAITPSKDELTEDNLDQLPDTSAPAPTATAASTAASSWDPRNGPGTPYSALQKSQPQAIRPPPASGFQASALKATGSSGRTPSYQRRVLDQEEAVRMPGNREVDRAAVQFGAFNLNGSGDEDVDGDREEPETRAQPPQHSPRMSWSSRALFIGHPSPGCSSISSISSTSTRSSTHPCSSRRQAAASVTR